jgi:hypothetical protein
MPFSALCVLSLFWLYTLHGERQQRHTGVADDCESYPGWFGGGTRIAISGDQLIAIFTCPGVITEFLVVLAHVMFAPDRWNAGARRRVASVTA